jgi:signal transduction histidine kinase
MLLTNYAVFTLLMLLVLIGLLFIFNARNRKMSVTISPNQIHYYDDILMKGNYDEFPTERLLGSDSYIVVLNEEGKSIYPKKKNLSFSTSERKCIPDYVNSTKIQVHTLKNEEGQMQYTVSVGRNQEYILDENYFILYASKDLGKDTLTEKEYKLLTDRYDDGYSIQKYEFMSLNNKKYTLLLYQAKTENGILQSKRNRFVIDSIVIFILAYVTIILCFSFWLNYKIKNPLNMLCQALNNFSGVEENAITYKGPKEFMEICDSFNEMSSRLLKSEAEKKKLENGRQTMIAGISHDLKTPITVLLGYAKALNDGVVPKEEQKVYLETIEQKANYLTELINTFHEYSMLGHPNYKLALQKVDICNYLRDYIAERYNEMILAGFHVEVHIPESHVMCYADVGALRRAFTNILSNTLKYNDKGTTILVSLSVSPAWIRILLGDNGTGIPKEIADTLFEPFVLGEKSRTGQGSGLGLSVAEKIVEAHGGMIQCMSDFPKGWKTTFEIMLPRIGKESL